MPVKPYPKSGRQGPVKKLDLRAVARLTRDYERGEPVARIARRYGVSVASIEVWLPYAGLDERWLAYVRMLERSVWVLEKRAHKAETCLKAATQVIRRLQPSPKRRATCSAAIQAAFDLPRISANVVCGLAKSTGHVSARQSGDHVLVSLMREHLENNPGSGFRRMFDVALKTKGYLRSDAERAYREARLERKGRAKPMDVPDRVARRIVAAGARDEVWSVDFLVDALPSGKRYYIFSAIDVFSRECVLCIALPRATAQAVLEALEGARRAGRKAETLHSDNGAQFKSEVYMRWTKSHGVVRRYSRPGNPTDNAHAERFNRTLREELLDWYRFKNLSEVQRMLDDWRVRYNMARPHNSLHGLSPLQFVAIYSSKKGHDRQ